MAPDNCRIGERRKCTRVNFQAPVSLRWESDFHRIETTTQNLSSEGFYCVSETPVLVDQKVNASLLIPVPGIPDSHLWLECEVRIVRVELVAGGYALGCHIENYSVRQEMALGEL